MNDTKLLAIAFISFLGFAFMVIATTLSLIYFA